MKKMEIKTQDFKELSIEVRNSLLAEWRIQIVNPNFQLFIDEVHIKDRDELHDWRVDNGDLFQK